MKIKLVFSLFLIGLLTSCQEATDMADKGKQYFADNIEISCVNATQVTAPVSIQKLNQKEFYSQVGLKIIMNQDFSKQAILDSIREVASNQTISCDGVDDNFTSIQLNLKPNNQGFVREAIEAYLNKKGYNFPIAITSITKKGDNYAINSLADKKIESSVKSKSLEDKKVVK